MLIENFINSKISVNSYIDHLIEQDTKDIKVKNPGILQLPSQGFKNWSIEKLVKHMTSLAQKIGRNKVSKAIQNLIRWNKNDNHSLSKKAQSVFDKYVAKLEKE